jgi:hypothetical protein
LRQEDKQVDGPELEQAEERKRETELVEEKEDEVYDLDGQQEHGADKDRAGTVMEAMQRILRGETISIEDLKVSKRHEVALEALITAVQGRDPRLSRFVYAEDRRTLLEQSLAVLQPELANLDQRSSMFEDLLKNVGELRGRLNTLQDAEGEEQVIRAHEESKDEADQDEDDKPDQDEDNEDEAMLGFEETIPPRPTTTLGDPDEIFGKPRRSPT